jgi:hypothetical protein
MYVNDPVAVGVPEIVTVFAEKLPVTPEGKPLNVAPEAPVVEYVIFVNGEFTHMV